MIRRASWSSGLATEHVERGGDAPAQVGEPIGRGGAQPGRAVGESARLAQQSQQARRVAVGPVDRWRRPRLAVDPVALEPDQATGTEVDDVALEVHAVGVHVERRDVDGAERLAELPRGRDQR